MNQNLPLLVGLLDFLEKKIRLNLFEKKINNIKVVSTQIYEKNVADENCQNYYYYF